MIGVFVYDRSLGMCEVRAGAGLCYSFFVLTLLRMNFYLSIARSQCFVPHNRHDIQKLE